MGLYLDGYLKNRKKLRSERTNYLLLKVLAVRSPKVAQSNAMKELVTQLLEDISMLEGERVEYLKARIIRLALTFSLEVKK